MQVQDVGLPEEVERAIDKAGAMRAIGNMQMYTQYETANSINDAANNPGGLAAAGVGIGMGFGMGGQMAGAMGGAFNNMVQQPGIAPGYSGGAPQQAAAPQPPPMPGPPPIPAAVQMFVAINGQQTGPFDIPALQQMAMGGQLTRETLVWKQGMAAWSPAGTVAEMAPVFGSVPPPMPQ